MAMFGGGDIVKHNYSYVIAVLENIKDKKKIKVKGATEVITFDKTLQELLKLLLSGKATDKKVMDVLKPKNSFKPMFDGKRGSYKWTEIDKAPYSGNSGKSDATETKYQELASLLVIEAAVSNKKMPTLVEISKVYANIVNKPDWIISLDAQYKRIKKDLKKTVKNTKFNEFNRDGSFMDWVSKLVRPLGISKKDNWNPADVWLLKDKWSPSGKLATSLKSSADLVSLNEKLRTLYYSGEIVGISLKKTGKEAYYELVNLEVAFKNILNTVVKVSLPMGLSADGKDFRVKSSMLYLSDNIEASIRTNQSSPKTNIVYEFKKKNSKAQLGKVPTAMLKEINKKILKSVEPGWKTIPFTINDFDEKLYRKKYTVLKKSKVEMGVKNEDEFISNIQTVLKNGISQNASSILQSLDFFYNIFAKPKEVNSYFTEMAHLSQKKGPQFGPFGKLH